MGQAFKAIIATGAVSLALLTLPSMPAQAHAATSCLQQMAAAALREDAEVETDAESVLMTHPSAATLQPLLDQMGTCLAQVLPVQADRTDDKGGPPQHVWFRNDTQEFCRSSNKVETVGGTSAKKDYRRVSVSCGTMKKP